MNPQMTLLWLLAGWLSLSICVGALARQPLPPTGSPAPHVVEFTDTQINEWRDRLAEHVKPREFFKQLQSDRFQRSAVYVQFRPGTDPDEIRVTNMHAGALDVRWQSQIIPGLMQVVVDPGREHDAILAFLDFDRVIYAEPDYLARADETIPDDPHWDDLWGMHNIRAPEAWDYVSGHQSHRIAVLDSGALANHSDLKDNVDATLGWDFFNGNDNPHDWDAPNTCNYHGSHVTGTIAARGNNGIGVAGVVWQATAIPIKVLGPVEDGNGEYCCCGFNFVRALEHALIVGARVSNHSYGGPNFNQSMFNMILAAQAYNHIVVASAGNDGNNNDSFPTFPASYDLNNVISVANITGYNSLGDDSSYGPNSVHLGAPGTDILSTEWSGSYGYLLKSGTSMAAPHVTGAIALLQIANSNSMPYTWIRARVIHGVEPTPALQGITTSGGRLDLRESMNVYGLPAGTSGGAGSKLNPFNNFDACLNWTPDDFQLHLYPSTSNWTGTINQPIEIRSAGGTATIGLQ